MTITRFLAAIIPPPHAAISRKVVLFILLSSSQTSFLILLVRNLPGVRLALGRSPCQDEKRDEKQRSLKAFFVNL